MKDIVKELDNILVENEDFAYDGENMEIFSEAEYGGFKVTFDYGYVTVEGGSEAQRAYIKDNLTYNPIERIINYDATKVDDLLDFAMCA